VCFLGRWIYRPVAGALAFGTFFFATWAGLLCWGGMVGQGPRLIASLTCGLCGLGLALWLVRFSLSIMGAIVGVGFAVIYLRGAHVNTETAVGMVAACCVGFGFIAYTFHVHVASAFLAGLGALGVVSGLHGMLETKLYVEDAFANGFLRCTTDACVSRTITFFTLALVGWLFQIYCTVLRGQPRTCEKTLVVNSAPADDGPIEGRVRYDCVVHNVEGQPDISTSQLEIRTQRMRIGEGDQ